MENKVFDQLQFIVIKLGNEQFGINIKYVQNIVRMMSITRVPKSPDFIAGIINLRGEIIPVMSLRKRFNLESDVYSKDTRIIIIKYEGTMMGIIVDVVKEVISLTEEQIEKMSYDANDERGAYLLGVGKLGSELVTLLNVQNVIEYVKE